MGGGAVQENIGYFALYVLHNFSKSKKSLQRFVKADFSPLVFNLYSVLAFLRIFSCMDFINRYSACNSALYLGLRSLEIFT